MIQENTPAKVGLLELLLASSGVQFVIPAYQRNYTWTANREVKQLLDDIKAVLKGERNECEEYDGSRRFEEPSELYGLFSHTSNKRRICVYEVFKQSPHTAESYKV